MVCFFKFACVFYVCFDFSKCFVVCFCCFVSLFFSWFTCLFGFPCFLFSWCFFSVFWASWFSFFCSIGFFVVVSSLQFLPFFVCRLFILVFFGFFPGYFFVYLLFLVVFLVFLCFCFGFFTVVFHLSFFGNSLFCLFFLVLF